jgi:hypothetical protein
MIVWMVFRKQVKYGKHLCCFVKDQGDEIWYHGYHISWTQRKVTGGPSMSWSTRPKDAGQVAHN